MKCDRIWAIVLRLGHEAFTAVTMKSGTCNVVQHGQCPTAYCPLFAGLLLVSVVDPDAGGSNVLRNVCRLLSEHAPLNSRSEYISQNYILVNE
jgi:hypothetical protein